MMKWRAKGAGSLIAMSALAFGVLPALGCGPDNINAKRESSMAQRDINLVKEAHTKELMSVPGVIGVYVGALDDGKPCIGVMVVKKSSALEQRIPGMLEGYPVRIDETGEIKPLK
ncbi:MAG TPA: hypothetical protein VES59_02075 [Bacteroidota bacterium]|nr:hypothetical protein [Bacteroidota bacterium]